MNKIVLKIVSITIIIFLVTACSSSKRETAHNKASNMAQETAHDNTSEMPQRKN